MDLRGPVLRYRYRTSEQHFIDQCWRHQNDLKAHVQLTLYSILIQTLKIFSRAAIGRQYIVSDPLIGIFTRQVETRLPLAADTVHQTSVFSCVDNTLCGWRVMNRCEVAPDRDITSGMNVVVAVLRLQNMGFEPVQKPPRLIIGHTIDLNRRDIFAS